MKPGFLFFLMCIVFGIFLVGRDWQKIVGPKTFRCTGVIFQGGPFGPEQIFDFNITETQLREFESNSDKNGNILSYSCR